MNNFDVFFWNGLDDKIPLCCIFFFMEIELKTFPQEYRFKDGDGYIRCPDCLVQEFQNEKR